MKKTRHVIIFLLLMLIVSVLLGLRIGAVKLPLSELFLAENYGILKLRIFRIILAIIAGAGLSISGVALQAILKNPLAEPYILGVSSGAATGAVLGIILGLSETFQPILAFATAILTIFIVIYLAKSNGVISIQSLILIGVIIGVILAGITTFLISVSSSEALHGIIWWLLGSLQVFSLKLLTVVFVFTMAGISAIWFFSQDLNAMSLGEDEAKHLGINTEKTKIILIAACSLITAGIVSCCGIIGFVGLIIPHISRLLVGQNHRHLIPVAFLGGAAFMVICDLISRAVLYPVDLPIGVITSLIGGPILIALLKFKGS